MLSARPFGGKFMCDQLICNMIALLFRGKDRHRIIVKKFVAAVNVNVHKCAATAIIVVNILLSPVNDIRANNLRSMRRVYCAIPFIYMPTGMENGDTKRRQTKYVEKYGV